jgi:hypothetical protein
MPLRLVCLSGVPVEHLVGQIPGVRRVVALIEALRVDAEVVRLFGVFPVHTSSSESGTNRVDC